MKTSFYFALNTAINCLVTITAGTRQQHVGPFLCHSQNVGQMGQLRKEKKVTLKKLKELLASGAITKEEYDELAKNAKPEDKPADPEADPGSDSKDDPDGKEDEEKKLERLIQAAVDRATNRLGNENKQLKEQLSSERKKNLSAEELKKVELQEKEAQLVDKEKEIREKENRMYAVKALKKAQLDDGSEDTLELVEFVLGEDEAAIDTKVKALQKFAKRIAQNTTDEIYHKNGREPGRGSSSEAKDNPWDKDSWNLTQQMELEINKPELAKALKASARK